MSIDIHPEILAKSEQNGNIFLYQHLKNVADVARVLAKSFGLDERTAVEGAILHDIGKASPLFQRTLLSTYKPRPGLTFRHEIASLFFISLVGKGHQAPIIEMIAAHHKSIYKDIRELGLLDLDDQTDCFADHIKHFDKWNTIALDILQALGMSTHPISKEEAQNNYEYAVEYCSKSNTGCSAWRGLLMASDHIASATETLDKIPLNELFIKPDLSFYNRQNSLYPLSLISTDSMKKHTIVSAPTGAGKTDFLLRRCSGRVFYTLPFQASINAMYDRIKKNLSNTSAQIHLLHAASELKIKEGKVEESILQKNVGASIKILTPHQMMSVVFGIKGYEAMALDLKGCDIILDEIHTYSDTIQAIVLRIIEILNSLGCRIHVGTATMPSALHSKILQLLGGYANVLEIKLNKETLNNFNRHKIYKITDLSKAVPIIDTAIANNQKILIVCNQVKRSQSIYNHITETYPGIKKMLIHSRYKRSDRVRLESELKNTFNTLDNEPCIVVSTQVVEVSLDISFDLMITECAPIDALTQRFGRINRKRTKESIGHYKPIYIIAPPENKEDALPYSLDVLQHTYDVLPADGEILQEKNVQELIDAVYPNIAFQNIDYSGVAFSDGKWQLKLLCHHAKSALLETLDINSAVCIKEEDKATYLSANPSKRIGMEIPINYHSIAHRNLEQIEKGMHPFVIPNQGYNDELGLLLDMCKTEYYQSFEIL